MSDLTHSPWQRARTSSDDNIDPVLLSMGSKQEHAAMTVLPSLASPMWNSQQQPQQPDDNNNIQRPDAGTHDHIPMNVSPILNDWVSLEDIDLRGTGHWTDNPHVPGQSLPAHDDEIDNMESAMDLDSSAAVCVALRSYD